MQKVVFGRINLIFFLAKVPNQMFSSQGSSILFQKYVLVPEKICNADSLCSFLQFDLPNWIFICSNLSSLLETADSYIMKSSIIHWEKKKKKLMENFQLDRAHLLENLCFVHASSGNWFLASVSVGPIE